MRILLISGSASEDSVNTRTLEEFALLAEETVGVKAALSSVKIGQIPHYAKEIEEGAFPDTVTSLREEIEKADAVVLATPQHNGHVPGALMNALDWSTRGEYRRLWAEKPVGIFSVSPSSKGADLANEQLSAHAQNSLKARVMEPQIRVGSFEERQEKIFGDPQHRAQALALVQELIQAARSGKDTSDTPADIG